jgi:ArsR family transcriptional regulator, arsenate/arsenite/antimonite-responsive transcriptional repressor
MDTDEAAIALAKLGHPIRLRIIQILVKAGRDGLAVGDLQKILQIPGSTLSHHITHLINGGLLEQERKSRTLVCRANFEKMEDLVKLLTDECCTGVVIPS